ncbi:MAG: FtsX-like permease family protein [Nitrospirales bacterium]|nr:ABC transporter permease [Nitrospirales bacterium]
MVSLCLRSTGAAIGCRSRANVDDGHPEGRRPFVIQGIFYDYSTDGGKVVMDERLYRSLWPDALTTVFAVYVERGSSLSEIRNRIEESFSRNVRVHHQQQPKLRTKSFKFLTEPFVTYVLELIALSVAVLGIVNTLMTAIMEQRRELATLRALGASGSQIKTLIYWEAGYLVFLGGRYRLGGRYGSFAHFD